MLLEMNRKQVVRKHNPIITKIDRVSPLSIGNGEFGFSTDFTGLQTFPEAYESPLSTQSNWGWHHSYGQNYFTEQDIKFQQFDTYGRQVKYPMQPEDKEEAYHWLRQNPHRLQLGRISFRFIDEHGREIAMDEITCKQQELDLWTGILHSEFYVHQNLVKVTTVCHPHHDIIGVKVESSLINEGRLRVFILFPAPDIAHTAWAKAIYPNWANDDRHTSELTVVTSHAALIKRQMDADRYEVKWAWNDGELRQTGTHEFTVIPDKNTNVFEFSVSFAKQDPLS